jgi:hypothetical protein
MYIRPHGPAGGPHRDLIEFIIITSQHMQRLIMGGRHIGGGGSGLANINLEQHSRRDQLARVARATVAKVRVVGMLQVVWVSRHKNTPLNIVGRGCARRINMCSLFQESPPQYGNATHN